MKIQGDVIVGEAARFAGKAGARLNGHPRPVIIANVVSLLCLVAIMGVWIVLQTVLKLPGILFLPVLIIAVIVSLIVAQKICRIYAVRFARKALAERGLVSPVPTRFEITPDAFVSANGRAETRAPWAAVSDLFPVGDYWFVMVEACSSCIPKRLFASPDEEKAFIAAMLEHMTPDARDRSDAAVRFVG